MPGGRTHVHMHTLREVYEHCMLSVTNAGWKPDIQQRWQEHFLNTLYSKAILQYHANKRKHKYVSKRVIKHSRFFIKGKHVTRLTLRFSVSRLVLVG